MAIYPVIHKETGERKEIDISVHEIMEWYKNNPEWKRDWSQGCASPAEAGEWRDNLVKKHPGWNDVLRKVSKTPGANIKPY